MTILLHTPYGSHHKESSLMYLVANYLHSINLSVLQITCNGLFSLCDRDEENSWKRQIDSCLSCISDQCSLARWSSIGRSDLSKYIQPDEIVSTRRMVNGLSSANLKKVKYYGIFLYDLCLESFKLRSGGGLPDLANKKHEQLIRRYMLSAMRMCLSVKRLLNIVRPELTLLASGEDFITRSYIEQAKLQKKEVILFKMDIHERCVKIINLQAPKVFNCPLLINDVTSMRGEVSTWPKELAAAINDIVSFLGVSDNQITLPLAR